MSTNAVLVRPRRRSPVLWGPSSVTLSHSGCQRRSAPSSSTQRATSSSPHSAYSSAARQHITGVIQRQSQPCLCTNSVAPLEGCRLEHDGHIVVGEQPHGLCWAQGAYLSVWTVWLRQACVAGAPDLPSGAQVTEGSHFQARLGSGADQGLFLQPTFAVAAAATPSSTTRARSCPAATLALGALAALLSPRLRMLAAPRSRFLRRPVTSSSSRGCTCWEAAPSPR